MSHRSSPHEWNQPYEYKGTTYRECSDPDCPGHQQWVCALDRWSEAFEAPSPRQRDGQRAGPTTRPSAP